MNEDEKKYIGGCLCGKISFQFTNPRPLVGCHCRQCRQSSGHFVVASNAKLQDFQLSDTEKMLKWYQSSDFAKRGFCQKCGTQLFYQLNDADHITIFVGSLKDTGDMTIQKHIFCSEKGDYYQLPDDVPQHQTLSPKNE
ncbi:MAG: GFA family protein [Alphaproteobacteria bacterium]|nr:GFA family protein [Alphaproteobacteria bacterium]